MRTTKLDEFVEKTRVNELPAEEISEEVVEVTEPVANPVDAIGGNGSRNRIPLRYSKAARVCYCSCSLEPDDMVHRCVANNAASVYSEHEQRQRQNYTIAVG